MALLKMYANNTHIFTSLKKQIITNEYSSFLISNANYGFEDKHLDLYKLLDTFDVENDLRRKLKSQKVELKYEVLRSIDLSEQDEVEEVGQGNSGLVLEIGRDILKNKNFSVTLMRLQIK